MISISACLYSQVHNVNLAYELMMDAGLPRPKARPEGMLYLNRFQLNNTNNKTPLRRYCKFGSEIDFEGSLQFVH